MNKLEKLPTCIKCLNKCKIEAVKGADIHSCPYYKKAPKK